MKRISSVFTFAFLTFILHAQQPANPSNTILNKIELYGQVRAGAIIFSHFDKTIYTNNEDVWFTTYLLQNKFEKTIYNVVSIALINDDNSKICLEKMFVMNNGLAFGHFTIPDTLSPGNYHILTYTNVLNKNGLPEDVFSQPITLKTAKAKNFSASVALADDGIDANGTHLKALVSIINNTKPGLQMNVEYILAGKKIRTLINKDGKLLIEIPRESTPKSGYLKVIIKQNDETSVLSLKLPLKEETPVIKFYPEGGSLVTGLVNCVGFEAKTSLGRPLKISGIIYKNNYAIDTVQTNSYGIGRFKVMPEKNARYILKITGGNGKNNDNTYVLPPAIADFPVIYVKQALEDDTLHLQLKTAHTQKILLLVHNYTRVIAYRELELKAPVSNMKIILIDAPKGLATVTLLDTLGRPLAERHFFAHYSQKDFVDINTDKTGYLTRQKVTVKLSLRNSTPMPVNGAVSIACVQDNRVESANQKDIVSYMYLQHQLQELPPDPLRLGYFNKEYVEDVLLVRGWQRYTWPDMLKTFINDTVKNIATVHFTGAVKEFGKVL